jgi:site-specific DNA-methyltransferase (adenine-specific)
MELIQGDCLEVMKSIPSGSIDAIITDPPYGTTACKWDSVIDFDLMWEQLNRIIKSNGAIVLFGSEPFSSALRMSNIKNYKYDWIWYKNQVTGMALAKYMPMRNVELISVFTDGKTNYYPIMEDREWAESTIISKSHKNFNINQKSKSISEVYGIDKKPKKDTTTKKRYPTTLKYFKSPPNRSGRYHPTQKPVPLMEYLIKTYTNEGETVLDFTMGSGSTMVACQNTNRKGIGIEQDIKYFKIAQDRVEANKFKLF